MILTKLPDCCACFSLQCFTNAEQSKFCRWQIGQQNVDLFGRLLRQTKEWITTNSDPIFRVQYHTLNFLDQKNISQHIKETRGPWATSLTWENSSNQLTHISSLNQCYDIITLIKRRKNPSLSWWELNGSSFE